MLCSLLPPMLFILDVIRLLFKLLFRLLLLSKFILILDDSFNLLLSGLVEKKSCLSNSFAVQFCVTEIMSELLIFLERENRRLRKFAQFLESFLG